MTILGKECNLKHLGKRAAYIVSIVAVLSIVSRLSIKIDRSLQVDEKLDKISAKVDTVIAYQLKMEKNQVRYDKDLSDVKAEVNSLSQSYTRYLLNDRSLTTEQFYEYMKGIGLNKDNTSLTAMQGRVLPILF